MSTSVKSSVRFYRIVDGELIVWSPIMRIAHKKVLRVYESMDAPCVITSACDGKHGRNSLHYKGLATDYRTWVICKKLRPELANRVRQALGPDFDVVLEDTHLHVEYDPKEK